MPELPTREELAEIIHDVDRCVTRHVQNCPYTDDHLLAADAVLHRLMRDADIEWTNATVGNGRPTEHHQAVYRENYWRKEGVDAHMLTRRSVTFTGKWEPADPS